MKKIEKMHFFELWSHITFEILLMNHFKGVLPPSFTPFPIRKNILKHPKCFWKKIRACFFALVRCGRDGTENPSFTRLNSLVFNVLINYYHEFLWINVFIVPFSHNYWFSIAQSLFSCCYLTSRHWKIVGETVPFCPETVLDPWLVGW